MRSRTPLARIEIPSVPTAAPPWTNALEASIRTSGSASVPLTWIYGLNSSLGLTFQTFLGVALKFKFRVSVLRLSLPLAAR